MTMLQKIKELGFTEENGLCFFQNREPWSDLSPRIKHILEIIQPLAFYCIDQKPFILFYDFTNNSRSETQDLNVQIWNSQVPIVIIEKENNIEIFNGFRLNQKKKELEKLANSNKLDDFSFWNIISGKTWIQFEAEFKKRKLDDYLLENIKATSEILYKTKSSPFANLLILRLIFVRYLIDRGIELTFEGLNRDKEEAKNNLVKIAQDRDLLYALFLYLKDDAFNGDLFDLYICPNSHLTEKDIISQEVLNELGLFLSGADTKSRQLVFFDLYDFNIIPVELISNIYERFLGKNKQKNDGAFYTPPFLVDYILKNTISPFLLKNKECKVLDPACGSGIFLVETLRLIIERNLNQRQYIDNNDELLPLLTNNLFGIDKNKEAIDVAIFSLYITLLDYKNPKKLQGFKFPDLRKTNFIADNFFNIGVIDAKLKNIEFDFIIGNPPWGSQLEKSEPISERYHYEYVNQINKDDEVISDYQIAQSYLHRLKKIASQKTQCALIITSKVLYNIKAKNFRLKFMLPYCQINQLLELSPVRHQIYNTAVGPSAIIFYNYVDNSIENKIKYVSLKPNIFFKNFKIIVQESYDTKLIPQKIFMEYDWAWKLFVYGNILDFHFLKRLKNQYDSINDIITKNNFQFGVGIQIGGGDDNDSKHLIGKSFVNIDNDFERFYIAKPSELFNLETVHRPRISSLFQSPFALMKKGVSAELKSCAAYYDKDIIFTDSITAIKGSPKDSSTLRNIVGLLNSDLFSYYILMTGSSVGIEREQVHNEEERFTFPIIFDEKTTKLVEEIECAINKNAEIRLDENFLEIQNELDRNKLRTNRLEDSLNEHIQAIYSMDDIEKEILDYGLNVSIPILRGKSYPFEPMKTNNDYLPYVKIFTDYFSNIFNEKGKYIQVNIYTQVGQSYFTAIEFDIVKNKPKDSIRFIRETKTSIDLITRFSVAKRSQYFYEQKDIIGFEEESFYIIKPNEYKNWHPALAHLDLGVVVNSLFQSVKKRRNG